MSTYVTRWCATHGDWDDDVDHPEEGFPTCIQHGLFKTRSQLEARILELEERLARAEGAEQFPDTEADGVVFCGKCGHQR